jgi:hypothetical protein
MRQIRREAGTRHYDSQRQLSPLPAMRGGFCVRVTRSVLTIKRWKREEKFPKAAINVGMNVLWKKEQVLKWIQEREESV